MQILSFDIGGSKIAYAVVDESGRLLSAVEKLPTPITATEIADNITKVAAKSSVVACGIATAGVVFANRLQGKPNNLPEGYQQLDFAALTGLPTVIINDANAAVWAEYKIGALHGVQHGVLLTLGTDVGCGIICNGQLLQGKYGAAGEVNFAFSGRSLQKMAAEQGLSETDCFAIAALARQGNVSARSAYRQWEENLLDGLAELNRLLDTQVVALSGSVAAIVDYAKINTALKLLQPHNAPQVVPAVCANNAGIIGAALFSVEQLNKDEKNC